MKDFFFDNFIIDDLFFTFDIEKINKNCKNFNIKIGKSQVTKSIFKSENIAIITIYIDDENQIQYFVAKDLDMKVLDNLPDTEFQVEDKILIKEVYSLIS